MMWDKVPLNSKVKYISGQNAHRNRHKNQQHQMNNGRDVTHTEPQVQKAQDRKVSQIQAVRERAQMLRPARFQQPQPPRPLLQRLSRRKARAVHKKQRRTQAYPDINRPGLPVSPALPAHDDGNPQRANQRQNTPRCAFPQNNLRFSAGKTHRRRRHTQCE